MSLANRQLDVTALYRQYGRVVYRRCLRLLHDPSAAEDATQEVFLRLTRHISRFDVARGDPHAWIYGIATFYCLNTLRTRAFRQQKEAAAMSWELAPGHTDELFSDRRLALQVIQRFDPATQAIALGVLVDGVTQEELATSLGLSSKTVARKLERFLLNARKYVARSAA